MKRYIHRFQVRATLSEVAKFHQDTRALKSLTPPPVWVTFHEVQPVGENSKADFTMWMGPIPVHWIAVHTEVDALHGFTDTQVEGPFDSWVHSHRFRMLDENTTEVVDDIQGKPGKHLFWGLVSRFMWVSLPFLFTYREWVTRRA
jgi:ligand-binding SRPBCC domain-containing protein